MSPPHGDMAAVGVGLSGSRLDRGLVFYCAHGLLAIHRLLQVLPGLRVRSEGFKRVLRAAYGFLLFAVSRGRHIISSPPEGRLRPASGASQLPSGWDQETESWTRQMLETGDATPPFPAWDCTESESDAVRLRGCLPYLAEHYCATGEPRVAELISLLLASVVEAAPRRRRWVWDTTNTALRLITLLRARETLRRARMALPPEQDQWLERFLRMHEAPLALGRAVEPDGNHTLLNVAGRAAHALLKRPEQVLPSTLREELHQAFAAQFLSDGGHAERSPHYHLQSLALFQQLCRTDASRRHADSQPPECARAPLAALSQMVTPSGEVYRFGDASRSWSGRDRGTEVRELLEWANHREGETATDISRDFGLVVWEWLARGHRLRLVADIGPLGSTANPGHGHADALSFCLYVDGEEVVTDPGTFSYSSDPSSTWFKLPQAHSTVHWIDTPSYLLSGYYHWTRFPPRPELTAVGPPPRRLLEATQRWRVGRREFLHCRRWIADSVGLRVIDRLESGPERAAVRLQLPPSTHPRIERDGGVTLKSGAGCIRVSRAGTVAAEVRPVEGWYAPAYGRRSESAAVEWVLGRSGGTRLLQLDFAVSA